MKALYLSLAVVGTVVPWGFFLEHLSAVGPRPGDFVAALFASGPAGGFTVDLVIASLVFWLAMFHRRRQEDAPAPWPFILLNLAIGLSCALPAYLYARERRLEIAAGV